MRLSSRLRHYWHELYYRFAPESGVDFAMRCKDVTEKIDLGEIPTDFKGLLRFTLHLSLCNLCHFYSEASRALRHAVQGFMKEQSLDIEQLNQKLLEKFKTSGPPFGRDPR